MVNISILKEVNKNKTVFLLLLVAFILRLAHALYSYLNNVMSEFKDDLLYFEYAEQILKQNIFVLNIEVFQYPTTHLVGPGVPWLLSGVFYLFSKNWLVVFIINSIVSTLFCYAVYKIASKILGNKTAILSLLISSFYVLYIKSIPTSGKEIYISLLFLLVIYVIYELFSVEKKYKQIAIIALVYTSLLYVDERYFAYIPLIVIFISLFTVWAQKKITIKAFVFPLLFITIVTIMLTPWTIRNFHVYDKIVILTKRTTGFTDKILGYEEENIIQRKEPIGYLTQQQLDSIKRGYSVKFTNGKTISEEQMMAIKKGKIPYEFNYIQNAWASIKTMWRPIDFEENYTSGGYRFNGKWSIKHNVSVGLTYGIVLIFSIIGLFRLFQTNRLLFYFSISIFIYHTFIHAFLIPFITDRYRIPLDSILIIIASYGLIYIYDIFNKILNRYNQNILHIDEKSNINNYHPGL